MFINLLHLQQRPLVVNIAHISDDCKKPYFGQDSTIFICSRFSFFKLNLIVDGVISSETLFIIYLTAFCDVPEDSHLLLARFRFPLCQCLFQALVTK